MSAQPNDAPDFDFTLDTSEQFDPTQLADTVLWPIVNRRWGNDWLGNKNFAGNYLEMSYIGSKASQTALVTLEAHSEKTYSIDISDEGDSSDLLRGVVLTLYRQLNGVSRDMVIKNARKTSTKDQRAFLKKTKGLYTVSASSYAIDTEGDLNIGHCQEVRDEDFDCMWTSSVRDQLKVTGENLDSDALFSPVSYLRTHDMDAIEEGLAIMGVSKSIRKAFENIRDCPVLD